MRFGLLKIMSRVFKADGTEAAVRLLGKAAKADVLPLHQMVQTVIFTVRKSTRESVS